MSQMVEAVKEEGIAELRKSRAVSTGVADLMKALKPNKKGGKEGISRLRLVTQPLEVSLHHFLYEYSCMECERD